MARPSQLTDTILWKLQPFNGKTFRANKDAIIKAVGGKVIFGKYKANILDYLKNNKKSMDKGKGHAIYKSKTGPQKFKLTKENEKILAFVESKKDVLGKFCAPEDHDTEPQHVSQAKQVIPSMLRLAMEQHVLEMMCPNFQGVTWQTVVKAFVGQDPYWALLKMQVLRDYDRREDEEVMLFGGVPSNVKASAKGLWKLTRAHTEGIWLPLDAPHLFRNGGWIRDQLVSYTLISKKRLPNMKDEEFFRMTHLFLRGGHQVDKFPELVEYYRKKPSQLFTDYHQAQREEREQREEDDRIAEQLQRAEQERASQLQAEHEAQLEAQYQDFMAQLAAREQDIHREHQRQIGVMRSVYTSNRERLQERNERLTRIVRKQTNLIRGYENNLDDLVPQMWARTGTNDWYDSDISSQAGFDPLDPTGKDQLPFSLVNGDEWNEEEKQQQQSSQEEEDDEEEEELPQADNVLRTGPSQNQSGTPPLLSMRTLDYMRRIGVASRAQAIQPLPPAATLSPLTITLMNYEEEREEPGSSLWQIWNVRDTQQIMDVDDEAVPQPTEPVEMIKKQEDKQ